MYSEAFQDEFVDLALGKQTCGFFVDVGAGCPEYGTGSNTVLFEERGWRGIAIDADLSRLANRKCILCTSFVGDGSNGTVTLGDIMKQSDAPEVVDYLSIDVEGADYEALKSFVLSGYKFKVATIEHNLYANNEFVRNLKEKIFFLLSENGYVRVVDNAGNRASASNLHFGVPFEDWYINPRFVNYQTLIRTIKNNRKDHDKECT